MEVFIALYRGINVLGKNSVKMESLRAMHERLEHRSVKSYIQSGNIVLSAKGSTDVIAQRVAAGFVEEFGFAPKVVVVAAKRLATIVEGNPYAKFSAENPTTVHAGICQGEPCEKELTALLAKTGGSESFAIGKGIVYLHAPTGSGHRSSRRGWRKRAECR
jgi:uncharacterized protein (DUF1697 family)